MSDPTTFPALASVAFPYVELAVLMFGANLYLLHLLLPNPRRAPALDTMVVVGGLLLVSLSLWLAIGYGFLDPGDASTIAIFLAANSMMAVAGAWLIAVFLRAEEKRVPSGGWWWPLGAASLLVGTELTMGCAFSLGIDGPSTFFAANGGGWGGVLASGVGSVWFEWTMGATMTGVVLLTRPPRLERRLLLAFVTPSIVAPWVVADPVAGAAASAGAMGFVLLLTVLAVRGEPHPSASLARTELGIVLALALTSFAGGVGALLAGPSVGAIAYSIAMFVVMIAEAALLFRRAWVGGEPSIPAPVPTGSSESRPSTASEPTPVA